jgi:hypothetical protein
MEERKAHISDKRKVFIALIFSFITVFCFNNRTYAQGWSFTFKMYVNGNCYGATAPTFSVPNMNLPTKSECESFRNQILAIKYNVSGCSIGYTCTPCTGSDIVTPGQGGTTGQGSASGQAILGDISFEQGKAFFTTNPGSAFEDWARDYRQQLESYGITSILGKNITPNPIPKTPLTGNIGIDADYARLSADFNPVQDASVVDLSEKEGIVKLLRTDDDIKKEDEWLKEQGLYVDKPIPEAGLPELDESNFKLEEGDFWTTPEMIDLYVETGKFALMFTGQGAVATVLKSAVSFTEEYKTLRDVFDGKDATGSKTITLNTFKTAVVEDALIPAVEQAIGIKYGETGKIAYKIAVYDAKAVWGAITNSNNGKK